MLTMQVVNIYQAKTQLSSLINQAVAGQEIIIANAGKPVVRIVPYHQETMPRKPGLWAGQVQMDNNFDQALTEFEQLFYGKGNLG